MEDVNKRKEDGGVSDDNSDEWEDKYDDEYHELTEENMIQFENDAPYLINMVIDGLGPDPDIHTDEALRCHEDFVRVGRCIGNSTALKHLKLTTMHHGLCWGMTLNRSITHIYLDGCILSIRSTLRNGVEVSDADVVSEFFQHNKSLRVLKCQNNEGGKIDICSLETILMSCDKQSLRRIELDNVCLTTDEDAAMIINIIATHRNIQQLSLVANYIGRKACTALGSLLASPKCKVNDLDLGYNDNINDECIRILLQGLTNIEGLCLSSNDTITTAGFQAIASFLGNPNVSLVRINLGSCSGFDDEAATAFSAALTNNNKFKVLVLPRVQRVTALGWRALSQCIGTLSALDRIDLSENGIGDEVATSLAQSLMRASSLRIFDMTNSSITSAQWPAFFRTFPRSECRSLEQLRFSYNEIDDAGLEILSEKVASMSKLSVLKLSGNHEVTTAGWQTLSNVLRAPGSKVRKIGLNRNLGINDDVLTAFANALVNNTSLEELNLTGNQPDIVTARGWARLTDVLCNRSSLDSTYDSNYTLGVIAYYEEENDAPATGYLPRDLVQLLGMNRYNNKSEAGREKILGFHFPVGNSNMNYFADMGREVLPHALAWVGRDYQSDANSLLFELVRSIPVLFETANNTGQARTVGRKRRAVNEEEGDSTM